MAEEDEKEIDQEVFHLSEDLYAITFVSFMKDVSRKQGISSAEQARYYYACMFVFIVQVTLIAIIYLTVIHNDTNFKIYTPDIDVVAARLLAAYLLHMELVEDVRQGITMIKYLNLHPDEFDN